MANKFNWAADGENKSLVNVRVLPPWQLMWIWTKYSIFPYLEKSGHLHWLFHRVLERISKMGYLVFMLLGALWNSWICGLMSFATLFFQNSCPLFFQILFQHHYLCLSFHSRTPITHMLYCLILSHSFWMLCSVFLLVCVFYLLILTFFSLCFN